MVLRVFSTNRTFWIDFRPQIVDTSKTIVWYRQYPEKHYFWKFEFLKIQKTVNGHFNGQFLNFVSRASICQKGLSISFLWVEKSICKVNPIFIPPLLGLELKPEPILTEFWSKSDNSPVELRRSPSFQPMPTNRSQFVKISSFFIKLETDGRSPHKKVISNQNNHILKSPARTWLS